MTYLPEFLSGLYRALCMFYIFYILCLILIDYNVVPQNNLFWILALLFILIGIFCLVVMINIKNTKYNSNLTNSILRDTISLLNLTPDDCIKIQYSRLNEYYKTIIQFSKAILQNYFIRSSLKGESKGFNFIVNMNKVYEDFITTIIEEIVQEEPEFKEYIVERQEMFDSLVKEKKIITRPDIILRKRGPKDEYPIIIDTKYKRDTSHADLYQIMAYALAIPTSKICCLIYPESETITEQLMTLETEKFGNTRPEIKIYNLNVDLNIDENVDFNFYIDKVKSDLKNKLNVFLI